MKWTDTSKKHMYQNGWPKERPHWSKKTPVKEPPKQLQTYNVPTFDVENTNTQISEEIYNSLTSHGLFPEQQKGWCKGSTGELLYTD